MISWTPVVKEISLILHLLTNMIIHDNQIWINMVIKNWVMHFEPIPIIIMSPITFEIGYYVSKRLNLDILTEKSKSKLHEIYHISVYLI